MAMGMAMKAYISGPISKDIGGYKEKFAKAEQAIVDLGWVPLNPAMLPLGMTQRDYMKISLAMLDVADFVVQLDGWEDSEGAIVEYKYAKKIGIPAFSIRDAARCSGAMNNMTQLCEAIWNAPRKEDDNM